MPDLPSQLMLGLSAESEASFDFIRCESSKDARLGTGNSSGLRRCETVRSEPEEEGVLRVVLVDFDGPVNDFALYSPDRCPDLSTKSVTGEICGAAGG